MPLAILKYSTEPEMKHLCSGAFATVLMYYFKRIPHSMREKMDESSGKVARNWTLKVGRFLLGNN